MKRSTSRDRKNKRYEPAKPIIPDDPEKVTIDSGNVFGEKLTKQITSSMPGTFVYSPFLVRALVGQAALGGVGATAEEIGPGLKWPPEESHFAYAQAHARLWEELTACIESGNILMQSNRFYIKHGFELRPEFTAELMQHYNAEVAMVNFSESAFTSALINSWFENATNNHIHDIIQPKLLSMHTRILLLSTAYFAGEWKEPFSKKLTQKLPFLVKPNKPITVDMMCRRMEVMYAEFKDLDAKAISLPFAGNKLHMIFVIPQSNPDLAKLRRDLPSAILSSKIFNSSMVDIQIPRFSIESAVHLIPALQNAGIKTMFHPFQANFSKVTGHDTSALFVSEVIQKVRIDIAETFKEMAPVAEPQKKKQRLVKSIAPPTIGKTKKKAQRRNFYANRPFIFQIVDKDSGLIVFAGTCTNPLKLCSVC